MAEEGVLLGNVVELVRLHLPEMLDRLLVDVELDRAVAAFVKPLVLADVKHVEEPRGVERRIHADALDAAHLLGVGAAHRGADHEVRRLLRHQRLQHRQRLGGVDRDVRRDDAHIARQELAPEQRHGAAGAGRGEAVEIDDLLHPSDLSASSQTSSAALPAPISPRNRRRKARCPRSRQIRREVRK